MSSTTDQSDLPSESNKKTNEMHILSNSEDSRTNDEEETSNLNKKPRLDLDFNNEEKKGKISSESKLVSTKKETIIPKSIPNGFITNSEDSTNKISISDNNKSKLNGKTDDKDLNCKSKSVSPPAKVIENGTSIVDIPQEKVKFTKSDDTQSSKQPETVPDKINVEKALSEDSANVDIVENGSEIPESSKISVLSKQIETVGNNEKKEEKSKEITAMLNDENEKLASSPSNVRDKDTTNDIEMHEDDLLETESRHSDVSLSLEEELLNDDNNKDEDISNSNLNSLITSEVVTDESIKQNSAPATPSPNDHSLKDSTVSEDGEEKLLLMDVKDNSLSSKENSLSSKENSLNSKENSIDSNDSDVDNLKSLVDNLVNNDMIEKNSDSLGSAISENSKDSSSKLSNVRKSCNDSIGKNSSSKLPSEKGNGLSNGAQLKSNSLTNCNEKNKSDSKLPNKDPLTFRDALKSINVDNNSSDIITKGVKRSSEENSVNSLKKFRKDKEMQAISSDSNVSNQSILAKSVAVAKKSVKKRPKPKSVRDEELRQRAEAERELSKLPRSLFTQMRRKDLENLILELFTEKVFNDHELGEKNDLCRRLEATLETTRKKGAQFHKEIEDLKKVMHRLQAEHIQRKGQTVTPVKIKRSVGIQATPAIINKGLMSTSMPLNPKAGVQKLISPNKNLPPIPSPPQGQQQQQIALAQVVNTSSTSTTIPLNQVSNYQGHRVITTAQQLQPQQMVMVNNQLMPIVQQGQTTIVQQGQNGSYANVQLPVGARIVSSTPLNTKTLGSPVTMTTVPPVNFITKQGAGVIDLTDDEEAKNRNPAVSAMILQRNSSTGTTSQFVTLPPASVGQLLLVPANGQQGAATALVMAKMPTGTGLTQATIRHALTAAPPAARAIALSNKHPAPLPIAPPQQTTGGTKKLPPLPLLKLSHKNNSIVLSWNMAKTDEHEKIASYQLYAYQEGVAPPTSSLWKKVGSVKALELPMACTLTQFMPGHVYHFAVRAVDARSRLCPFSEPRSIRLGK